MNFLEDLKQEFYFLIQLQINRLNVNYQDYVYLYIIGPIKSREDFIQQII
jgi:hypothetical protein